MPRGEKSGDSGYTAVPVHSKEDVMQEAITGYHKDEPKVPRAVVGSNRESTLRWAAA